MMVSSAAANSSTGGKALQSTQRFYLGTLTEIGYDVI
jgi:hypothetical protein